MQWTRSGTNTRDYILIPEAPITHRHREWLSTRPMKISNKLHQLHHLLDNNANPPTLLQDVPAQVQCNYCRTSAMRQMKLNLFWSSTGYGSLLCRQYGSIDHYYFTTMSNKCCFIDAVNNTRHHAQNQIGMWNSVGSSLHYAGRHM